MVSTSPTTKQPFSVLLKALIHEPTLFTPALAQEAATQIMAGDATDAQVAAFLLSLKFQGKENDPAIIAAVASAMRDAALQVEFPADRVLAESLVDIVGTGGDGHNTFNVSTAAGIVAAGAGCKVAKHGNRASSSACGSADVLEALDCHLTSVTPESVPEILHHGNFCFLFSQRFHPAMKNVAGPRKEIGVRTIFNLLGPLSNPTLPRRLVVGVHSKAIGKLVAEALHLGGVQKAWVVNGEAGLDEISPIGQTHVWEINESGTITDKIVTPADFGLTPYPLADVVGGDAQHNAAIMRKLLDNALEEDSPILNFVLLNAAALLFVAGKAETYEGAVAVARESIRSGNAKRSLEYFARETQELTKGKAN
ncbi:anthranilate phosphoribosyltransferase [Rhizophlyctis rosea]|nr:anthranilate phosphoribosyltransferase [Rhizophlyctis rosea]